ncbi:transcription cofactor [Artemisia annua]|uniref:Transcription cofactor n=1 Tax=Artemisia annua TaxID=35608 RepID=A0A2U1MZ10_ARTAN|nr:transcription cofactor [Artemisia annua]
MPTMETRSQNPVPDSMQASNCLNPTDPASLDSTDQTPNANGGDWQEEVYQKIKAMKDLYLHDLNDMRQKILGKLQHRADASYFNYSVASLDSTDQTPNANCGDWQEEVYQKIKAMKDLYLHDLNDMRQKILGKLQHHDSLPQQPKNEQLEKLEVFKNMLERFMAFLQIPKQSILPSYKDKLGTYEKQIVYIINHNRKPEAPQQHKSSLDSTVQTRNANSGDWQEEVHQKIIVMKDLYLHDLNDMHQKLLGKLQHHDSLPQQPKNEQLEKLKVFKNVLERFMAFLQIPKQSILPSYKDKLGTYEKQIVNVINSNRRKPEAPQQHKSSFDSTDHTRSANGGDWQEEAYQKNRLHQERGFRSKCSNIVLKKETDEHNYRQPKKQRTAVSEVVEGINVVEATNNTKMGHRRVKSITLTSQVNGGHSLDNARIELPDLNVPYTVLRQFLDVLLSLKLL